MKTKKHKKIIPPIIIAILLIAMIGGTLAFWYWVQSVSGISLFIVILLTAICLVPIIGIIIALIQRIKEINGGEEDEASKY